MSRFFSGPSSAGTCNACGGNVVDGGQSGYYCQTPGCRHSYGGPQPAEERPRLEPVNDVFMVSFPHSDRMTRGELRDALAHAGLSQADVFSGPQ
jgi:hypothetical protein